MQTFQQCFSLSAEKHCVVDDDDGDGGGDGDDDDDDDDYSHYL